MMCATQCSLIDRLPFPLQLWAVVSQPMCQVLYQKEENSPSVCPSVCPSLHPKEKLVPNILQWQRGRGKEGQSIFNWGVFHSIFHSIIYQEREATLHMLRGTLLYRSTFPGFEKSRSGLRSTFWGRIPHFIPNSIRWLIPLWTKYTSSLFRVNFGS